MSIYKDRLTDDEPPCPECDTNVMVAGSNRPETDYHCHNCGERFNAPIQRFTDTVSISKAGTYPPRLHIPQEDSVKPICRQRHTGSYRTRSADSYPLYYAEMCSYCRNKVQE